MRIKEVLGAAAIATVVSTNGTGAATLNPSLDSQDPFEFFDRLTHPEPSRGNSHLGQIRITPEAGHAIGAPQVYAVRDEKDQAQCIIGSNLAEKTRAYTAAAFDQIVKSGNLDGLESMRVDIDTLTKNGSYAYPANTTPEDGFFRSNAGFNIAKVAALVDGKVIDLSDRIEPSHYTTKATDEINDTIQDAYFAGRPVTYVYLSQNGHTVVDTFQMDPSVIPTFEKCLDTIAQISIPQNDYVTFQSIPFPEATPEIIEQIKGSQCISGLREEDIVGVRTIQSVTGAIVPFSYSLVLKDGTEVVSDFLKKDADGQLYVSQSLMQFAEHTIASCAGNVPVATPPQLTTSFFPPASVPIIPVNGTPFTPGTPYTPPVIIGGGCVTNCNPNPPCITDCGPGPSPVPLPPGLLLMLGALSTLGMAGAFARKPQVSMVAADKPQTLDM